MMVACPGTTTGPGQLEGEFNRGTVRKRDGRRWRGRRRLDWSQGHVTLQGEKRTSQTRPSPTIRLKNGDSRMSMRTPTGVSNAVPLNAPCEPSVLGSVAVLCALSRLLVSMISSCSALARARIPANTLTSDLIPGIVACLSRAADRAAERVFVLLVLTDAGDEKADPMMRPKTWISSQRSTTSLRPAGEIRGRCRTESVEGKEATREGASGFGGPGPGRSSSSLLLLPLRLPREKPNMKGGGSPWLGGPGT